MKAQKFEGAQRLALEPTLGSLAIQAERADSPTAPGRLLEVQALLAEDLGWVEEALAGAAAEGPLPATDATRHLVGRAGKRIRPIAALLSAACFGSITKEARELAVVAELVHSATLLHDDVIDDGMERRGAPAARLLWGNAVSVLSGDLLLVHALERTLTLVPDAISDLVRTLRCLVDGEIVQLRGRGELDVSEATYLRILRDKTASLFAWATRNGARLGGAGAAEQQALGQFGEELGIAFQLVDDVLDYTSHQTGKTLLADLRQGKLTLPLVLAVAERPDLMPALSRVYAGDQDPVEHLRRAVLESGACQAVERRAAQATERAVKALQGVTQSPARRLLEHVAQELFTRLG